MGADVSLKKRPGAMEDTRSGVRSSGAAIVCQSNTVERHTQCPSLHERRICAKEGCLVNKRSGDQAVGRALLAALPRRRREERARAFAGTTMASGVKKLAEVRMLCTRAPRHESVLAPSNANLTLVHCHTCHRKLEAPTSCHVFGKSSPRRGRCAPPYKWKPPKERGTRTQLAL